MSLGYAEKLSYREDLGGQLGAPELFDSPGDVITKVERLAQLVQQARRIVAFTGAGISTACGIPDFRGPGGIWTLQRAGQPLPRPKVSFTHAKPSLTHQVLLALMRSGKLDYLVSQNVDGLHLRSGIPRDRIAELHGNCFAERCHTCGAEYIRDFEIETVGFKRTGRKCSQPGCGAALRDHILDWEDALPEDELELSEQHAKEADLAICLGTSLQITPACNLPLKATRTYKGGSKQEPGQLAIVNLQHTQHDNKATKSGGLVCYARCDEVMAALAERLGLAIPAYERRDAVVVGHQQHASGGSRGGSRAKAGGSAANGSAAAAAAEEEAVGSGSDGDDGNGGQPIPFSVFVQSSHGAKCPMPMVQAVDFDFEDPLLKPASLSAPPFTVQRTARRPGAVGVKVTLHLHETADQERRTQQLSYTAELQAGLGTRDSLQQQRFEFVTQRVEYGGRTGRQQGAAAAADSQAAGVGAPVKEEGEAAPVVEAAAAAVAAVPQAAAEPAVALGCPKQQRKKQRMV
ncbi:hypothetical protein ABPG75_002074 [Micractinium tetrahymenae]